MRTLYIFATSLYPDAYINLIAYALQHRGVDAIQIHVIHEDESDAEKEAVNAFEVLENIHGQLKALASGQYVKYGRDPSEKHLEKLTAVQDNSGLSWQPPRTAA